MGWSKTPSEEASLWEMQGLVHRFQERLSWGFALACLFSIGTGIIALAPKSISSKDAVSK